MLIHFAGRCYSCEVLVEYMRFCQKQQLHLISDEIFALSVWDNVDFPNAVGFTSVSSISTRGIIDPGLVHILWGMSKVVTGPLTHSPLLRENINSAY